MFLKKFFGLLSIIFIIFSIYFSKNISLDASSDTLILQNDKTYKYYQYYNNIFPSKNFLVLAVKSDTQIDQKYIKKVNKLKKNINKIKNVESTFSIVDAPILLANNLNLNDLSINEIENINNSNINLESILNELSTSLIFKDQIINSNKNISSIIIYINKNNEFEDIKKLYKDNIKNTINKKKYKELKKINNKNKEELIKKIRKVVKSENNDYDYFLGGIDMISSDTLNFVKNDIIIFSFAVIFFIILILLFIYRSIKWVLIPLITSIYSVIIMMGFIGFFKWEITAISSNFISLMLILSVSINIHIINHYKLNYKSYNIIKTMKKMFWPCIYTTLTTIVAFGSLLFSNIKPIVDFGNIMVAALIFIFITSFTILPLIITFFPKINNQTSFNIKILNNFYRYSFNYSKTIIIFNGIIFLLSIVGIYKLNVENSFINYFKKSTEIYKGMRLIDTELGGTTPIDIVIKFKDNLNTEVLIKKENYDEEDFDIEDDFELTEDLFNQSDQKLNWFTEDRLKTIKDIHKYLENKEEIGKVQSLDTLIDTANLINKEKLSIFELSILYNKIPQNYKDQLIKPYLSIEENMVKINARVKDSNVIERDKLISNINEYIENNFENIDSFKVNGLLVLYNNMLQSLFSSQIKSFGIILISIFCMFIVLFRSVKLSLIGIIPNIIASFSILGLIGLIKIPLDIMTITIAAITIGIAVDNTIHYIYRIKENSLKTNDIKELIQNTHMSVGNAVLTTSLTIAFGFSVLILSNFIPTILFGIFTSLAMIIAMLGVLLTLPSIMIRLKIL